MQNDLCTREGAEALAAHLRAYWRQRGHVVNTRIEEAAFVPQMRSGYYVVRSDMVNGSPAPTKRRTPGQ